VIGLQRLSDRKRPPTSQVSHQHASPTSLMSISTNSILIHISPSCLQLLKPCVLIVAFAEGLSVLMLKAVVLSVGTSSWGRLYQRLQEAGVNPLEGVLGSMFSSGRLR